MSKLRRSVLVCAVVTAAAGGSVAFASDAMAVAPAPANWGCSINHYLGGPPVPYDSYYSVCATMPAGHKQALLVTCKTGPGAYLNRQGPWVTNTGGTYGASDVNCNDYGGYYDGSYQILGS